MNESELNRDEIVQRAAYWLRHSHKCPVVLIEPRCMLDIPDVIGFKSGDCFLVEVAVSVSDFQESQENRMSDKFPIVSVGNYRYFVTPPHLIKSEDIPDYWGLAYVYPKIIRTVKHAYRISEPYEMISRERAILYWGLRKAQQGA